MLFCCPAVLALFFSVYCYILSRLLVHILNDTIILFNTKALLRLELTSSAFSNQADNNWVAAVGAENGQAVLYSSSWTDNRHYVCQYDCE